VTEDVQRASDTERERAVARLRDASTEGRLTLEELADRTGLAYAAHSHAELEHVTAGLPAVPAPAAAAPRRRWVLGVFGPVTRTGRWRLGTRTIALSVFAPVELDLRHATLPPGEATLTVVSVFGPVFVTVPEHVEVETGVISLLGPVHEEGSPGTLGPSSPRLRVNGVSVFGPIFVKYRRS
jgi:hypothetical protein